MQIWSRSTVWKRQFHEIRLNQHKTFLVKCWMRRCWHHQLRPFDTVFQCFVARGETGLFFGWVNLTLISKTKVNSYIQPRAKTNWFGSPTREQATAGLGRIIKTEKVQVGLSKQYGRQQGQRHVHVDSCESIQKLSSLKLPQYHFKSTWLYRDDIISLTRS